MALGPAILKMLARRYEPNSFVEKRFQRYDLGFKTDASGNAVLLFMGKKDAGGTIRGRRYARRLVTGADGAVIKDHWDDKGPVT